MQVAFTHKGSLAIALSGGADSWALVLLAQAAGLDITALTVDHKLRKGSTAEAKRVAAECKKRGIKREILTWEHDGVKTRIMERAREARYRLLLDYCHTHNIRALATAHHADDQAETVLLRLAKASDVGGLAALRPETEREGIKILRPLLGYTKQQLIDYVTAQKVKFITDPSNTNSTYARPRLRASAEALAAEGMTTATLCAVAEKMAAADEALDYAARQLVTGYASWDNPAVLRLPAAALLEAPAAIQQRALVSLWRRITGSVDYAPSAETLRTVIASIKTKQTFGGIVIEPDEHELLLYREAAAIPAAPITAPAESTIVWDSRYRITNKGAAPAVITSLGAVSTAALEKTFPHIAAVRPAAARAALPALVMGDEKIPVLFEKSANQPVYATRL